MVDPVGCIYFHVFFQNYLHYRRTNILFYKSGFVFLNYVLRNIVLGTNVSFNVRPLSSIFTVNYLLIDL
jgi:hypothetical protein